MLDAGAKSGTRREAGGDREPADGGKPLKEVMVSSRKVFSGRAVRLRVDEVRLEPEGRAARREVVEHPGAVALVPLTADGQVLLVRQYRYAAGRELLEIPAGTLEPGEDPEVCARRELEEETGRRAVGLEHLASVFTSPGFCDELMHIYLARLEEGPGGQSHPDEDERIVLEAMPFEEALALALGGRMGDAKSVAGLALAATRLEQKA